jgi:hypothetical protein
MGYIYTKYGKRPKGKKKKNKRSRKRNKKKIIYNEWKEVSSRQKILDEIGFDSYEEYMSSDLWRKKIRPKVKERFKGVCQSCKLEMQGKGVQQIVHHREYTKANLDGDTIEGLTLVCKTCHSRAHQYTTDEVIVIRSLEKTNEWLDKPKPKTNIKKTKSKPIKPKRVGKKKEWRKCSGCGVRMKKKGLCKTCKQESRQRHKNEDTQNNKSFFLDSTKEKLKRLEKQNRVKPSNSHTRKI